MPAYQERDLKTYYEGLETERLWLRPLTMDDVDSWTSFFENNPSLDYLDIKRGLSPRQMAKKWIEIQLKRYKKQEFGQLALISKTSGELIGTRGFSYEIWEGKRYLTYAGSQKPAYWRQGYATESSIPCIDYVFENRFTNEIIAFVHVDNSASAQAVEKLGFEEQSISKIHGRITRVYLLSQAGWEQRKAENYCALA